MQIIFLNTFEKQTEDNKIESAQLSICERQGIWAVIWMDSNETGDEPDTWFEGTSWQEMLLAFRHGISVKMGQGYTPIIESVLEDKKSSNRSTLSLLQCYGELYGNTEVFAALRDWRRARAIAEKKSAYLIATNRMLWMISAFLPQQLEELLQLPGWGESKNAVYGEDILTITASFERKTHFPLNWVAGELDPKEYTQWMYKQREQKYKLQMSQHHQNRTILNLIQNGASLATMKAEMELSKRELMERIEQLDTEGYDMEPLIITELSSMPDAEQEQIWNAMTRIGDRYLKPILQEVYGSEAIGNKGTDIVYDQLRLMRLRFRRNKSRNVI